MRKIFIASAAALIVTAMPLHGQRAEVADSLYAAARRALNSDNYRRAADMFADLVSRYPGSSRAQDAMYYRAYSLYRAGGRSDLTSSLDELERYNRTYRNGVYADDAKDLQVRVCGELARTGDERCGRAVVERATAGTAGGVGVGPGSNARASGNSGPGGASVAGSGSGPGTRASAQRTSDAEDERMMALNALMQMNSDQAVPVLKQVLAKRDDGSVALRKQALFLISQKNSSEVVDIMLSSAKNDPNSDVRETAVFWLSSTKDPRVIPVLEDLLTTSTDRAIQAKAVFSLAQTNSARGREALRNFVMKRDAPIDLRETGIFWLGQSGANTEFLRDLYSQLSERRLKDKVVASLGQNGAGHALLLEIARNSREESDVRGQAIFWLGQGRNTVADLSSIYESLDDHDLKEKVIFALTQSRETAAVDKLMDIAKNDKDKTLRARAVFWLGQSRDPRVAKFLQELING